MVSAFRDTFGFLDKIGVFDVVLPFLLVFTIVFAILDKTKVLGTDDVDGKKYTKKNLNSMIAFVTAFFVIASSRLVEIITSISANVVLLLLVAVLFLMLVGSLYQQREEGFFLGEGFMLNLFTGIMFVGLAVIFLNAMKTDDSKTWLDIVVDFFRGFWDSAAVASLVLIVIMILFIYFIVREPQKSAKKEGS